MLEEVRKVTSSEDQQLCGSDIGVSRRVLKGLLDSAIEVDDTFEQTKVLFERVTKYVSIHKALTSEICQNRDVTIILVCNVLRNYLESVGDMTRESRAEGLFCLGALSRVLFDYKNAEKYLCMAAQCDDSNWQYMKSAGEMCLELHHLVEAETYFEAELMLHEKNSDTQAELVADALNNLGGALDQQYRFEEAVERFGQAVVILSDAAGRGERMARVLNNLGGALAALSDFEGARQAYDKAYSIREEIHSPYRHTATLQNNRAELLRQVGEWEDAEDILLETLQKLRRSYSIKYPKHPLIGRTLNNLGTLQFSEARSPGRAEVIFEEAFEVLSVHYADNFPEATTTLHNLALVKWALAKEADAAEYFRRAERGARRGLGPDAPLTLAIREDYELFRKGHPEPQTQV